MKKLLIFSLVIFSFFVLYIYILNGILLVNLIALDAAHWALRDHPFPGTLLNSLPSSPVCSANWLESFSAAAQGDVEARDLAYQQAAACDPVYVKYLHTMYSQDLEMAQSILQTQPGSAESWFWVGDLIPERKVEYYRQGLAIDPKDGRRWISLGDALHQTDPQAAIQAYLQGCYNGDPGYNGCGRAGNIAQSLGLYEDAVRYYLLSSYPPFRQKGLDLAQKIKLQP